MTTATKKNPDMKSAGLKSVTVMADSIDYGNEMAKQLRIWDELVQDVRANAWELDPLRRSLLDDYLALDATHADTPLFSAALREFGAR